jgi:hypothetical protein
MLVGMYWCNRYSIPRPPPPPPYIAISSSCGGTTALASFKIPTSSRADFALSVVKYVYEVPVMPARCTKGQYKMAQTRRSTHPSTTNTMNVVFTVVGEIIVLKPKSAGRTKRGKRNIR